MGSYQYLDWGFWINISRTETKPRSALFYGARVTACSREEGMPRTEHFPLLAPCSYQTSCKLMSRFHPPTRSLIKPLFWLTFIWSTNYSPRHCYSQEFGISLRAIHHIDSFCGQHCVSGMRAYFSGPGSVSVWREGHMGCTWGTPAFCGCWVLGRPATASCSSSQLWEMGRGSPPAVLSEGTWWFCMWSFCWGWESP